MRRERIEESVESLLPSGVDELFNHGIGVSLQPLWPNNPALGCRLNMFFNHVAQPRSLEGSVHDLSDMLDVAKDIIKRWPGAVTLSTYNASFNHIAVIPAYVQEITAAQHDTIIRFNVHDLSIRSHFSNADAMNEHFTDIYDVLRKAAQKITPVKDGNVTYVDFGKR